jgi:GTPase SAR1 family protein
MSKKSMKIDLQKPKNNPNDPIVYELKIAVLGKSLVGKSALTYRFINDKFPTEHDTTIEDQFRVNVAIEGIDCRLGIFLYKYTYINYYFRDSRYGWPG